MRSGVVCVVALVAAGCRPATDGGGLRELTREFVYSTLALSPVAATGAGYHVHEGVSLDTQLDDFGAAAIDRERAFYREFRERLEVDPERLDAEDRADLEVLRDQVELGLLGLDTIQSYRHNPTVYVELIGTALNDCYTREYAPMVERFRHIVARLEGVPRLLDQARVNLVDAPETWTSVARQELEGNVGLVDETLRQAAPAEVREAYDAAAVGALAAFREFDRFLKDELAAKTSDWRLGAEKYARKFQYVIATDGGPARVLADAERDLEAVREQMFEIARPLDERWFPGERDRADRTVVLRRVLERIAGEHSTREGYFAEARRDLEEATAYVRAHHLVPLPGRENLQVIETPEFMRGIYSVGGFNPAPALEPELGAFYWLTPIPAEWPAKRVESKLREYNRYGLKILTIHEAMPGHYVQFEYANGVEPLGRRLLRAVYGNGPYIEGWAVYATEMLLDAGYLDNSPELRLTFLKQQLRVIANAILDVRLHTMGMTDEEAMALMVDGAFQEQEEAGGKLVRAKLSSCQLPTYYVGYRDWWRLRRQYERAKGGGFELAEFHERTLEAGAVPVPVLAELVLGRALE